MAMATGPRSFKAVCACVSVHVCVGVCMCVEVKTVQTCCKLQAAESTI